MQYYPGKWSMLLSKYTDKIPALADTISALVFSTNFRLLFTAIPIIQLKMNFVNE